MADSFLVVDDLRGGRSGKDVPTSVPSRQCVEALNVDFYYTKCGNKRWGATSVSLTGRGNQTDHDGSLIRHVPGADDTASELWTFTNDGASLGNQVQRLSGAVWSAPTLKDALSHSLTPNTTMVVHGASFNGKLYLTYKANSTVDRLHVWDGSTVRRVGIAAGASNPTTATGAGSIVSDTRAYRVAWTKQVSSVTTYRSEMTGFSGGVNCTNHNVTVTRPTAPNEGETHWELYSYSDDDSFGTGYLIATTAIATTTAVDSFNVLSGDAPPEIGLNTPPTSWKYIMVHGNRLLGAGGHESGTRINRVWFTPPLGSSNVGDDERIPETLAVANRVDLDESNGGYITGFGGVINGTPIVFKSNGTYRLQPTGSAAQPYQQVPQPISSTIGCIRQETAVMAEDENGAQAIYWLSRQGPYRFGAKGLEYLGYDMEDVWSDCANGSLAPAHGVWHADKKQIWWWIGDSTTSNGVPNRVIKFHVQFGQSTSQGVRGGWVLHSGPSGKAYASCMFSKVVDFGLGTSIALAPHISQAEGSTPRLYQCDVLGALDDVGTTYQSYVTTPSYALAGMGNRCEAREPVVLARDFRPALTATTALGMALIRDFSEETLSDTVTYDTEQNAIYRFGRMGVSVVNAKVVSFQFGDVGARAEVTWDDWFGVEAILLEKAQENRA